MTRARTTSTKPSRTESLPAELEQFHQQRAERLANIQVGDVIHDGLAISRVTGEGVQGSGRNERDAWTVTCIFPFAGQDSLVPKGAVRDVLPKKGKAS